MRAVAVSATTSIRKMPGTSMCLAIAEKDAVLKPIFWTC
jgi:hypothetical protein